MSDALSLMTLVEQQEAKSALLHRAEVAAAISVCFAEKKSVDAFGKEMERMAEFDPDMVVNVGPIDIEACRQRARELYPAQFGRRQAQKPTGVIDKTE